MAHQSLEVLGSSGANAFNHEAWWSIAILKQCIGASGALLFRHIVNASELFPIEQSWELSVYRFQEQMHWSWCMQTVRGWAFPLLESEGKK